MSIINDALKKTRRESRSPADLPPPEDETIIRPKVRTSAKPGIHMVLPAVLLVMLFVGLLGGLGYFVYHEYYAATEDESAASPQAVEPLESKAESPATEPVQNTSAAAALEPLQASAIPPARVLPNRSLNQPVPTPPSSAPTPASTAPTPAPAGILSEFVINGVMRGGSAVRIITNTGVYRIGDTVTAPQGFILQDINESTLILRSPEGDLYSVTLP